MRSPLSWLWIGFALTVILLYPGFMTWDSVEQLSQARTGEYVDWHPPVMAYIWSWVDRLISGPFGMLLLVMILVWTGTYKIISSQLADVPQSVRIAAIWVIIFFPPTFIPFAYIVKDNVMAGLLLVLYASVFALDRSYTRLLRRKYHMLAAVSGIVAVAVLAIAHRHNAFIAVFPALWFSALLLYTKSGTGLTRHAKAITTASVVLAGCVLLAGFINKTLTVHPTPSVLSLVVYDLTGMAIHEGQVFFANDPESPVPIIFKDQEPDLGELREHYNSRDWVPLQAIFDLGKAKTDQDTARIVGYWLRSIVQHPSSYLQHRQGVFLNSLGLQHERPGGLYVAPLTHSRHGDIEDSSLFISHNYRLSKLQEVTLSNGAEFLNRTWLTVPAFYMGFLFLYLAFQFATTKGNFSPLFYLSLSAFLYNLTLFALAPSSDFRYSHWTLYVAWLVLVAISTQTLVKKARQGKTPYGPSDQRPRIRPRNYVPYEKDRSGPNPS